MPDYKTNFRFPLVDLKKEYELIGEETMEAIRNVIERADFILGRDVREFEREFAEYCDAKYCVGVGSGTAALYIALICYGIGKGDDVIVPAFTFKASAWAVAMTGARPVLAEVEWNTANIDPMRLEEYFTSGTRAIIPVHIFGHATDMDKIMKFAEKHKIPVIEDACEAHGGAYKGRRVGGIGSCGAFSFYPSKTLGCYGDGGAILTSDDKLEYEARAIRNYGNSGFTGINSRLASIQAAVLRVKFKYLDKWNDRRREIADLYMQRLRGLPLELPTKEDYATPAYYLFVIKTKDRDKLKDYLVERGIEARVHFYPPIHFLDNFPNPSYKRGDFPVAERLAAEVLSLPMHPFLSDEDVEEISSAIKEYYNKK